MATSKKHCVFLVGCPRSGTTLTQSLLAAHPEIASFPESHFFWSLTANRSKWRRKFKLASPEAGRRLKQFLSEVQREDLEHFLPRYNFLTSQQVDGFVSILNYLTEEQEKSVWLEKTPRHLHHIGDIEKFLPDAKFIHVIRKGMDVVASMYEVTHQHPELWSGERDINACIRRWIEDVEISLNHIGKTNHAVIRYEDLVEHTKLVVTNLCNFVDLPFSETMLKEYGTAARQVSLKNEVWKATVSGQIESKKSHKFNLLFETDQKEYIVKKTSKTEAQVAAKLSSFCTGLGGQKIT